MTEAAPPHERAGAARAGPTDRRRTAWIVTYNPASDEPRVRRQAQSLHEAGWRVVVCGLDGRSPLPSEWTFVRLEDGAVAHGWEGRARALAGRSGRLLARGKPTGGLRTWAAAELCSVGLANWSAHFRRILGAAANPDLRGSLVIAHDHPACPPAVALARRWGARLIVDSHEYMLGALLENERWVRDERPYVKVMQDHYFARADQVLTVCEGIAEQLNAEQRLRRPVRVVRNAPRYEAHAFRPVRGKVTLLYHGLVDKVRDLEPAIEAMALVRRDAELVIRGPAEPGYADRLRSLAVERGVSERVRIEPPVPFDTLIACAQEADIGYFVYGDGSPQRRFTLPNKFFEYAMAGLALCVSDLPEMTRLLRRYDLGVVAPSLAPSDIAATIDALAPAQIEGYKRASLEAAKTLCWEREQAVLLGVVEELCGRA
jgi:glycosyltransferase involved in cell wall biosynthesis